MSGDEHDRDGAALPDGAADDLEAAAAVAGAQRPAVRLLRRALVTGVRATSLTWQRHESLHWNGPPVMHDRPTIIVGGYANDPSFYGLLAASLRAAGIASVRIMPPVDFAFADMRESAKRLQSLIDVAAGRWSAGQVDIIGHSEGGLVARWLISRMGEAPRVRRLVTLGTPHLGIPTKLDELPRLARWAAARKLHGVAESMVTRHLAWVGEGALRQMVRGSEFHVQLERDAFADTVEYLSICSRHDGIIPWRTSLLPERPNTANVILDVGPLRGNHAAIASTCRTAFDAEMQFLRRR